MAEELQMPLGIRRVIEDEFIMGVHYGKDENLAKCADAMSQFDPSIVPTINEFRKNMIFLKQLQQQERLSRVGESYLLVKEKQELYRKMLDTEGKIGSMRKDLMVFISKMFKEKGLMQKQYSVYRLKKLPLTLGSVEENEDAGASDDEEVEEF